MFRAPEAGECRGRFTFTLLLCMTFLSVSCVKARCRRGSVSQEEFRSPQPCKSQFGRASPAAFRGPLASRSSCRFCAFTASCVGMRWNAIARNFYFGLAIGFALLTGSLCSSGISGGCRGPRRWGSGAIATGAQWRALGLPWDFRLEA